LVVTGVTSRIDEDIRGIGATGGIGECDDTRLEPVISGM
jgi:hypothetical protein